MRWSSGREADAFRRRGDFIIWSSNKDRCERFIAESGGGNKENVGEEERVIVDGHGQEQPADVTTPEMNGDLSRSFRLTSPAADQPRSIPAMKYRHHLYPS